MNIVFVTQGQYALFYLDLLPLLKQKTSLERIGFYVTDKSNFPRCQEAAESSGIDIKFLKGWEIAPTDREKVDLDNLKAIESEFGEPFLWNALVMDRRVYNGVLTKFKQDYKPRFTHKEMLALLQKGFQAVTKFIVDINTDIIIGGFTPVTTVEYIFYRCAKVKGINYINLNPTKIINCVTFSEEIYREFPHIRKDYEKYLNQIKEDTFLVKAKDYMQTRNKKYEGVIVSSPKFPYKNFFVSALKFPFIAAGYYLKKSYLDNEIKGYHWGYYYRNIHNPLKDRFLRIALPYFPAEKLNEIEYAYYPLHVEPEIALSLFGREYLNQIELIRNIAKSLPVTWKLVVKDHPAGVGRRNIGYYKKLLEIPNVVLVSHYADSTAAIENAKVVFTVSGFSGFEAILEKKPVITFGKTFYDVLPDGIIRQVRSLQELPDIVLELLENYKYSEKYIICLIAAIMKNSVPLNLYEKVLNKKERVRIDNKTFDDQKRGFVDFMLRWIN
jgi:adenosine/AMP kinase